MEGCNTETVTLIEYPTLDSSSENVSTSPIIKGKIFELIKREISDNVKNNTVEYLAVKASRIDDIVQPAVGVVLGDYRKEINMSDLLSGEACKKYNVKAVTLCYPDEDKTRGICFHTNVHGTKFYEVANGSYRMTLTWHVDGKECKVKISVHDDGPVKLIESNGISMEQLAANNVNVGAELKALPLHKALASQF